MSVSSTPGTMWSLNGLPPVAANTSPASTTAPATATPASGTAGTGAPPLPLSNLENVSTPPDTLQLGNQLFSQVRPLAAGLSPDDAAKLTANDGLDKIFFTDENGKHYVAYQEKGHFQDVGVGYLGRFNGMRVKVDVVDDEKNTFWEGFGSVFQWASNIMNDTVGSEAAKNLAGVVTTGVGTMVAAASLKDGLQTTATSAPLLEKGFVSAMGGVFRGALSNVLHTLGGLVLFGAAALGVVALYEGVKAMFQPSSTMTLEMATGEY